MAKAYGKSVVWFNLAGSGVIPALVVNSRMEQRANSQEIDEVLTVLYAHPGDSGLAIHSAKDIGDVKFGIKPFRAATDNDPGVLFGWADGEDAFGDLVTTEPPFDVKPDPVNSGDPSDHMKKQGTFHKAPLNEVLTPGTYLSERQTQGPGNEGSVQDEDLSKPMNQHGQIMGATAEEDQGGGQVTGESVNQNPGRAVVTHEEGFEVFADAEGKTIGMADGAGGYSHIRDNPFPPGGSDHEGKPIADHVV